MNQLIWNIDQNKIERVNQISTKIVESNDRETSENSIFDLQSEKKLRKFK